MGRTLLTIGDTPVTLGSIAVLMGIVVGSYIFARVLQRVLLAWITTRSNIGHGAAANTLRLLHYCIFAAGIGVGLDTIGVDLATLLAAGAVVAVAVGFAMQNIAQNFVSGVILLMERSITEQDILQVDGKVVRVERLGIRATVVRTLDDEQLIVPNDTIVQSTVTNFTLGEDHVRIRTQVGVAYASNVDQVFEVLEEAAAGVEGRVLENAPVVLLHEFGNSAIVFDVSIWIPNPWDLYRARSQLYHAIWRALRDAEITIAFPQLDLYVKEVPALPRRTDPLAVEPPLCSGNERFPVRPRPGRAGSGTQPDRHDVLMAISASCRRSRDRIAMSSAPGTGSPLGWRPRPGGSGSPPPRLVRGIRSRSACRSVSRTQRIRISHSGVPLDRMRAAVLMNVLVDRFILDYLRLNEEACQ